MMLGLLTTKLFILKTILTTKAIKDSYQDYIQNGCDSKIFTNDFYTID
jgi:hypothetical protein